MGWQTLGNGLSDPLLLDKMHPPSYSGPAWGVLKECFPLCLSSTAESAMLCVFLSPVICLHLRCGLRACPQDGKTGLEGGERQWLD